MHNVPKPLNAEERYMYEAIRRLDALCHMMSSFLEAYAKEKGIATTTNTKVEEEAPKKATTRKTTTKKTTTKTAEKAEAKKTTTKKKTTKKSTDDK